MEENTSLSVNTITMFGYDYRVIAWQIYYWVCLFTLETVVKKRLSYLIIRTVIR